MKAPPWIILANKPRLLRGLLRHVIQEDPSLQIVAEVTDLAHLPALASKIEAQWVILSFPPGGPLPEVADLLLMSSPSTLVLALAIGRNHRLPGRA